MTALKIALLLLSTYASCFAQVDFRFYVFDNTKNEKLDYTFVQDVTVFDLSSDDPELIFSTSYRVSGINQKEFSFTTEEFRGLIPRKEYTELIARAKKLPTKELKDIGKSRASGWIKIDGKEYSVSASQDTKVRKQWQTFLDALLAKYAPAEKRKKSTRIIEGESVEPVAISFPQLLKNPKKFDGKRIRITGFYHSKFEKSSFASPDTDTSNSDEALWLGEDSSFADPKEVSRPNSSTLTIDGTFKLGPAGHWGLWMGSLSRVTAIKKVEQGRAGQRHAESEAIDKAFKSQWPGENIVDPIDKSEVNWNMGYRVDGRLDKIIYFGKSKKTGRWLAFEKASGVFVPDQQLRDKLKIEMGEDPFVDDEPYTDPFGDDEPHTKPNGEQEAQQDVDGKP